MIGFTRCMCIWPLHAREPSQVSWSCARTTAVPSSVWCRSVRDAQRRGAAPAITFAAATQTLRRDASLPPSRKGLVHPLFADYLRRLQVMSAWLWGPRLLRTPGGPRASLSAAILDTTPRAAQPRFNYSQRALFESGDQRPLNPGRGRPSNAGAGRGPVGAPAARASAAAGWGDGTRPEARARAHAGKLRWVAGARAGAQAGARVCSDARAPAPGAPPRVRGVLMSCLSPLNTNRRGCGRMGINGKERGPERGPMPGGPGWGPRAQQRPPPPKTAVAGRGGGQGRAHRAARPAAPPREPAAPATPK